MAAGTFVSACDGTDAAIIAALSCSIPMATVLATTALVIDSPIRVRVRARNSNGWGAYSELNPGGAAVEGVPAQMSTPSFDIATSTKSQVVLAWAAATGAAAGGSSLTISNYLLEWDAGAATWSSYQTPTPTGATSTGLTGGVTY